MRFARTAVVAAVFAALVVPTTAHAAPAASAPGDTITLPVQDALAQLPVRSEDRTGYERTKFKHWVDADKDGCNTRVICTPGLDQYTTPLVHNDLNLPTHLRDVRHK
ncbi:hypothetical protein ACWC2M_32715 [Streptomyces sp. NPDC001761]|uniref:hypothetical protein n=1 Tax=Streptomyces sp. NPDC002763 TaxID=3154427 RepID=UPI003332AB0C